MKLLTIKEASAAIRMSEGWIKKAIRDGKLQALHFGRSVRIKPEALEAYINSIPAKEPKVRQWPRGVAK